MISFATAFHNHTNRRREQTFPLESQPLAASPADTKKPGVKSRRDSGVGLHSWSFRTLKKRQINPRLPLRLGVVCRAPRAQLFSSSGFPRV